MIILRIVLVGLLIGFIASCGGSGDSGGKGNAEVVKDLDNDGVADADDTDIDGDGFLNEQDAFPLNAVEWRDTDGDGTGDNSDPDIDGDSILNADDDDKDGDGYLNVQDLFPADSTEWLDLDGDGVGDNVDADIDGDGLPNDSDDDKDGDSYVNAVDAFPMDSLEWLDTDGDGIGDNSDSDIDGDGVANENDSSPLSGPSILLAITKPKSLVTVGVSPIELNGTVAVEGNIPLADVKIIINGIDVSHAAGAFSAQVALSEGSNTIEARGLYGPVISNDTISVSLDATPPYITIDSHADGSVVFEPQIIVTGLINDIVRGTIEEKQASVTVNGIAANIVNRSYSATINLREGGNAIVVLASDQVGNANSESIDITYTVPTTRILKVSAGNGQSSKINTVLPERLQVKVLDKSSQPVVGETVVFRVIQGSGVVDAGGAQEGRALVVETDENGIASTLFKLGSRVGSANHKVQAAVVGYINKVTINASATGGIGNKISVNSGNNQRGSVGLLLPEAFVVAVTDGGANVVEGARVEFKVTKGGGRFQNGELIYNALTDTDGRATAELKLGKLTGIDAQQILATLIDAPSGELIAAGFTATAFEPKEAGATRISGVILDNQDNPIPGVRVRIDGSTRQAVTDTQGQFVITEAPIGPVHLVADGSTASIEGEFPSLSYKLVTISGVDNPLASPIYMVKINTENAVYAGVKDVVLEIDKFPGFKLEIAKNSLTFPDGSKEGLVSVTPVNSSKVPMAPPNGMQPQFIVTIQPTGTKFDPPARLTLPNVDAHSTGAQVEMYSYDHDLEEFVSIGLGTVSEDGTVIRSNPGIGVIKAGWHCGSQPSGQGCCGGSNDDNQGCPVCNKRKGNDCASGQCIPDNNQDPGQCKKCAGGGAVNDDSKKPTGDNAICQKCSGGSSVADTGQDTQKCSTDNNKACYTCKNGSCGNNCNANPDKQTMTLTTGDLSGLDEIVSKIKYLKYPPLEVSNAGASIALSGIIEMGEQCCPECTTTVPSKASYTKYLGDYRIKAFIKIGLIGTSGGVYEWASWSDYRVGLNYEIGPFVTVTGELGNSISYTDSDCKDDCLTVGINGGLAAQLEVGGSVRAGYDKWDYSSCIGSRKAAELNNYRSSCFSNFKGASAEIWATGGASVTAVIAVSDCPTENKCEMVLGKIAGKVFYKATIDLGFFAWDSEDVLVEGTFFEGATYSCS